MAIPVCNLSFNPVISELPFQVSLITDVLPPINKTIIPPDFEQDNNFLAFETTTASDITTHNVTFLNETAESKIMRIRNMGQTPGVWSDTVINNIQTAIEGSVPFAVEIIPIHTNFTMDLRWQLESTDGDFYGPYIGILDNIKYVPAGDYTLRVLDLVGNIINEQQISTDSVSTEVFIDMGYGSLLVNFIVPIDTNIEDYTYYLVSDFGDTSLSKNYDGITYDLENGLYYFVVMYQNEMLQKNDADTNISIYIYKDVDKIVTITITDDLKIDTVVEG